MDQDTWEKEATNRRKDLRHCKEQASPKKKLCPRSRLAQSKALPKKEPGALRTLEQAVETAGAATPGMSFLVTLVNRNLFSCL